jgi:hypothetical protein
MLNRSTCRLLLSCVLFGACVQSEPSTPEEGESVAALHDAPEDPGHKFSVGICGGPLGNGTSGPCTAPNCTGSLIAPNLVLTARHCVNEAIASRLTELCTNEADNFFDRSTLVPPSAVHVTLDPSGRDPNPRWLNVSEIRLPPGRNFCDDDIALLVLSTNVPKTEVTPIWVDIFHDIGCTPPREATVVGRGAIEETWDPVTGGQLLFDRGGYRRRILQHIPVVCVSNQEGSCGSILDYTILDEPRGFELSTGLITFGRSTSAGDSGAPLLDQRRLDAHRTLAVVGVVSYGGVDATGFEYENFGIRVDRHKDFLVEGATHAAKIGGYSLPAWAIVVLPD